MSMIDAAIKALIKQEVDRALKLQFERIQEEFMNNPNVNRFPPAQFMQLYCKDET